MASGKGKEMNSVAFKLPVIERIASFFRVLFETYFTFDNLIVYFAIIFSTIFLFYFIKEYIGNVIVSNILGVAGLVALYVLACEDKSCELYAYLHMFFIYPSLYCVNNTIRMSNYPLLPVAALLVSFIFAYDRYLPLYICAAFIIINVVYSIVMYFKKKEVPVPLTVVKNIFLLAAIFGSAHFISIHLGRQFYFKAFRFLAS
jgi:hypothetical protein